MISFGERLKSLRAGKNITQKEISKLLNLTDRTYRRYEADSIDPPTSTTIWLADYFDVSIDYLVGRSDDPARH